MFEDQIFAVVDLETTGTQKNSLDRIIQFGCALVKNNKVIKTYSFLIDPERNIPYAVENLTHIKNEDVVGQPKFSDYAERIIRILHNTIFVAHNVNFDLPFLNYELTRAGYEPLTNRALDTVELAQVVFPTLASFKLQDLSTSLKIRHNDPHRADSDALVTAKLLIKIFTKLKGLPQATLHSLAALSKGLTRDTDYVFEQIAAYNRQKKRPLSAEFVQRKNIVLRKQILATPQTPSKQDFPAEDQAKKKLFKGHLRYRRNQVNLINQLHHYLEQNRPTPLLVEAPSGNGKTFSYLFSYAYQLQRGKKLVVATPTKVLQEQVMDQEIPQLNRVTKLNLTAEIVKSPSHYLDLDSFVQTLFDYSDNRPSLVIQMKILIWLTETTTGDLDELQLTTYHAPIFSQITHMGDARVGTPFSDVDFWNYARYRQEQADILITNQAYLANHIHDTIWGQAPYLVIDEAHRFTDNLTSSLADSLQFESFWGTISHIHHLIFNGTDGLVTLFDLDTSLKYTLQSLRPELETLIHLINTIQTTLYQHIDMDTLVLRTKQNGADYAVMGNILFAKSHSFIQLLTRLQQQIDRVHQLLNQVDYWFAHQKENLLLSESSLFDDLLSQIDRLDFYSEQAYLLNDQINDEKVLSKRGFVLQVTQVGDPLSTNIRWLMVDPTSQLQEIYERFNHVLLISSTMSIDGDFSFIANNLGLSDGEYSTYTAKESFNFKKQTQVYALDADVAILDPNSNHFAQLIGNFINRNINSKNAHILVLFTNLDTIRYVYNMVANNEKLSDYEILAQGMTGSNERIAKRFAIAEKSVLLGANSFWEGIDFKDTSINMVVVTKLPFESPDQPEVQLRQQKLSQAGKNIFQTDTLPRAVLRFKQGFGRLIRKESDHGTFIILDPRFLHSAYSDSFKQSLPKGNSIQTISVAELNKIEL